MDFFSILTLLGGVGMFLYGMNLMGASLKNLAGGSLEKILERLTTSKHETVGKIKGFGLGTGVTAIIQSSAATSIMLIGFVNAGIMKLSQAIPVVFGANLGSTVTGQILRLGDLGDDNFIIKLFKPSSFAPVLICVGAFIILFAKRKRHKEIASILVGLGVLFLGMTTMEGVFSPLKENEAFQQLFISFSNPLLGILIGLVLTAVIQSSSASVGILQAISSTGVVTYSTAIPIIIGQNIGKCMTILLGSIGANKKAKRVSATYLIFNILGAIIFVVAIYGIGSMFSMPWMENVINRGGIANIHTGFNLITSILLLPFTKQMADLTGKIVGDEEESKFDRELAALDPRLLDTPSTALAQAQRLVFSMTDIIKENYHNSVELLRHYDDDLAEALMTNENFIDKYENALNDYLIKITSRRIHRADRRLASELLTSVGDLERIGDHCERLLAISKNIDDYKIVFSEQGAYEIKTIMKATEAILDNTFQALKEDDLSAVSRIEPLAQTIDMVKETIKEHHVIRLQAGKCDIQGGFALVDILTSLDRIGSHCSNIALHVSKKVADGNISSPYSADNYQSTEEYKALYVYYMSLYSNPIVERFEESMKELRKEVSPEVAAEIPVPDALSDQKADIAETREKIKEAKEKAEEKKAKEDTKVLTASDKPEASKNVAKAADKAVSKTTDKSSDKAVKADKSKKADGKKVDVKKTEVKKADGKASQASKTGKTTQPKTNDKAAADKAKQKKAQTNKGKNSNNKKK